MPPLLLLALALAVILHLQCVYSTVSEIEISALYDFWNSTQGFAWHWRPPQAVVINGQVWNFTVPLNSSEPCLSGDDSWQGVNCSASGDHITHIFLPAFGVTGTLPNSICDLSALQFLSLNANQLHGTIPSCVSRMTALTTLTLTNNSFTGEIPSALWELTQLRVLSLFNNHLTGTLPPAVGDLPSLLMLSLAFNLLSGSLPAEMGKLGNVVYAPIGALCVIRYILCVSVWCSIEAP